MSKLEKLKKDLKSHETKDKAKILGRFFKTGPGQYGEGDIFLGLKTAETRSIAKKYSDLQLSDVAKLLSSKIHEQRTVAVMILNHQFRKGDFEQKKEIYEFYLKNISGINNWDLVDSSAHKIMGEYLDISGNSREVIYNFARSNDLWKKRIAIMTTYYFIRKKEFKDALKIAKILLNDKHDLIHKAVGWMLREIGNRDLDEEERFLKKYYKKMSRTMLRYAIEKFEEKKRQAYLKGII
ncbi:MAG: DNA alkylation repair protein [Candidatus Pacebacteria bacterium]|nr:DNA alkylation repair protein [Candidatus Paceibacterota bacterium]